MNAISPEPHDHHHAMPHPTDVSVSGHDEHGMTGHGGHGEAGARDRHAGHTVAMFRDRFWITLLLSTTERCVVRCKIHARLRPHLSKKSWKRGSDRNASHLASTRR